MKHYTKQYINGEWREGCGTEMSNYNPYTGELLYTYKGAGTKDIDDAYRSAAAAFEEWAARTPADKIQTMKKLIPAFESLRADIAACEIEEGGKSINMANNSAYGMIAAVEESLRYPPMINGTIMPSNTPGRESFGYRMPKGVVGVISPWNVPFGLAARYIMPALACGNAVVLKPSSDTPATAFIIAEAFEKAGFPVGLFNAVAGSGSDIGDYFVKHPIPAMFSFTGSSPVGRHIAGLAGQNSKDYALEMGGNNVMILLDDADISRAAQSAIVGKFMNNGQVCMAVNRFLVMDSIHDQFVDELFTVAKSLKCGDPSDSSVTIGPLINNTQVKNIEKLIADSIAVGATVILEGKTEGNVIHPWVLTNVTNDMPVAANEVFGPVCSIIRVHSEAEAVAIANDTEYGLSGCLWTKDVYHGMQLAKQVQTGNMHINAHPISAESHMLFGGEKASGHGRTGGQWFINTFTKERMITAHL